MNRPARFRVAAGLLTLAASAAWADDNPLLEDRWKARPLVIVAPSADDPLVKKVDAALQRTVEREAFIEREMVLYRVVDGAGSRNGRAMSETQTRALLSALAVDATGPATLLLVGKDGGTKVTERGDVDLGEIFKTIDRMPMRQSR